MNQVQEIIQRHAMNRAIIRSKGAKEQRRIKREHFQKVAHMKADFAEMINCIDKVIKATEA